MKSTLDEGWIRTALTKTPARGLFSLLFMVFTAEAAVMFALPVLLPKDVSETVAAILDASLLSVILFPNVWWLLIQPLRSNAHRLTTLNEKLNQEITRRTELEERLLHQALHDPLTQLANRSLFMNHLNRSLKRQTQKDSGVLAVLFIDLDHFKSINDNFGHLVGDRVLIEVAKRLESVLRPGDLLARVGGDEFAVLITGTQDAHAGECVAQRIVDRLSTPLILDAFPVGTVPKELPVSASVGLAYSDHHHGSADQLIRDADVAMYSAKSKQGGRFEVFSQGVHCPAVECSQ